MNPFWPFSSFSSFAYNSFSSSLFVLSLSIFVAVFSACQLLIKIGEVREMLAEYGRNFVESERQFVSAMALLRPQRRLRNNSGPESQLGNKSKDSLCQCEKSIGDRCPPGKPGKRGKRGKDGKPGSTGLQGAPGLPGNHPPVQLDFKLQCRICPMGEPGDLGIIGDPGEEGIPGPQGQKGRAGKPGLPGEMGSIGTNGEKGMIGKMGKKGRRGKAALKGGRGERGQKGEAGDAGEMGEAGARGKPGKDGDRGKAGKPGKTGKAGRRGISGRQGKKGPIGEPGTDRFYCPCPREKTHEALLSKQTGYSPKNPHGRIRTAKKKSRPPEEQQVHEVALGTDEKQRTE